MTGSLRIADNTAPPDPYVRAEWTLDDGAVLELRDVRRFGRVAVVPAGVYDSLPTLHALGPEPLSDDFDPLAFHRALKASHRPVKTQLMSQRPVAGVGNIYADEALWRAGVHPASRRTSRPQSDRIHTALRGAHRRDRAGRNDAARLPHVRRRYRAQSGVPRVLRPIGPAVPALRHRAPARGDRPTGHDLVPAVPAAPMSASQREPATDRARLVGAAYGTPDPLMARVALYAYEREPFDFVAWVLDLVEAEHPVSARSRVVDIGCGPGRYVAALRERHPGITTVGLDLSPGMASATLDTGTPAAVADAMQLPIRSASCDVAIAAHMLYHVPDIALAAAELARVVDPSGVVAIVTNGRDHLRELDELASAAFASVAGTSWTAPARSAAASCSTTRPHSSRPRSPSSASIA